MEVHCTGIPEFLSQDALHRHLEPIMAGLGISSTDFLCEKFKRQKWANITFSLRSHGDAFLHKYGERMVPSAKPPRRAPASGSVNGSVKSFASPRAPTRRTPFLQLMGHDVFCSPSRPRNPTAGPGTPNPITMRALQHAAAEKLHPTRKIETDGSPETFALRTLSCGLTMFEGDHLVFAPEVEYRNITGLAKFSKRFLLITMQQGSLAAKKTIRIPLDTVVSLIYSSHNLLTLTLSEEPSFFEEEPELSSAFAQLGFKGLGVNGEKKKYRICNLDQRHEKVVGHCLIYQIEVVGTEWHRKIAALENHPVIQFIVRYDLMTPRTTPGLPHIESSETAMRLLKEELMAYTKRAELPFGIIYQLQALAWNAYLHPRTVLALAKKLKDVLKLDQLAGRHQISVDAMKRLFKTIDWPQPHGDPLQFNVGSIVKRLREQENEMRKESAMRRGLSSPTHNLALVYRITVTPSRTTLHGPELEAKNRILRKFPHHHEFFARVQFCDENGQDLFFNGRIEQTAIFDRWKRVLQQGVPIGGRTYTFLGFSHSSLRSHSAWFSAPFFDQNNESQSSSAILKKLGDFSQIRCPARCAARIGQAFSETPFSVPLDELDVTVKRVPDVTSLDGSRVFSDGVGTFSPDVLYHIWDEIPQNKAAPTAFQIRYRGVKGMVALDSRLTGSVMCIRPSMEKFESQDREMLEICDMASKPIPLVLNRQMIKILEDMGVEDAWFLEMQEIALSQLRAVTDNTYNVAQFLKQQNIGEGIRFYRFFRQIENMGIDYRQDPFLCSIVEASLLRELRLLKHKARIPIREGVTLFGILDETGFLKEGEVYVTFDTMNGRFAPPPAQGPLVVTRSPALHPGDIQLAVQKIPPEGHPLREHGNVIFFSRHGARDLPSQLSGGDLDGDIFNIIFDRSCMPTQIFGPADYPRIPPTDLGREVTKDDMTQFFVDFMKLDHLGVIATRHMILADQRPLGTRDLDCLKLASLHSNAVDFSKTGRAVDLKELPKAEKYRPDFFAPGPEAHIVDRSAIELDEYILEPAVDGEEEFYSNPRHKYYRSDKVLGRLYRRINEQEVWNDRIKGKAQPFGLSFWDHFLTVIQPRYEAVVPDGRAWVPHLMTARELRAIYEHNVSESMRQHSEHPVKPISELEVFIGSTLNRSGVQTNRQRDSSIKLKDSFDRMAQWITKSMRSVRHNDSTPLTGYQTKYDNLHLCLACVHAGGEKDAGMQGSYYRNMQSFRVVAACALLSELNLFDGGGRGGGYVGVRDAEIGMGVGGELLRRATETAGHRNERRVLL